MVGRHHERHDRNVCRIEYVFAPYANQELAGYCDNCGERGDGDHVSTQQQSQRQRGNQRAQGIEARYSGSPCSGKLDQECRDYDNDGVLQAYAEIQREDTVRDERAEHCDLVMTWILKSGFDVHAR